MPDVDEGCRIERKLFQGYPILVMYLQIKVNLLYVFEFGSFVVRAALLARLATELPSVVIYAIVCTHNNLKTKYKQLRRSPQKVTGSESRVWAYPSSTKATQLS